jgi:hypothetical protein
MRHGVGNSSPPPPRPPAPRRGALRFPVAPALSLGCPAPPLLVPGGPSAVRAPAVRGASGPFRAVGPSLPTGFEYTKEAERGRGGRKADRRAKGSEAEPTKGGAGAPAGKKNEGEGEFLDTVIGIPDSRTEIVMLRPPDGDTLLELSSFVRPDHLPGSPAAMANELGLRNVAFEVDDLQTIVDRLLMDGYALVGSIGQYEGDWRMAYVRGPEGIIVSLAERIG